MSLIIFDLDDTLINTREALTLARREVLRHCFDMEEQLESLLQEWLRLSWFFPSGDLATILPALSISHGLEMPGEQVVGHCLEMYRELELRNVHLHKDAPEVLTRIRGGRCTMALLCAGEKDFQLRKIEGVGLREYFPHDNLIIIPDGTTIRNKPHPDGILELCQRAVAPPQATVYIGDRVTDVIAGRLAGCKTILYFGRSLATGFPGPLGTLNIELPDFAVFNLSDIPYLVELSIKPHW